MDFISFHGAQKEMLGRMSKLLFSMQQKWTINN